MRVMWARVAAPCRACATLWPGSSHPPLAAEGRMRPARTATRSVDVGWLPAGRRALPCDVRQRDTWAMQTGAPARVPRSVGPRTCLCHARPTLMLPPPAAAPAAAATARLCCCRRHRRGHRRLRARRRAPSLAACVWPRLRERSLARAQPRARAARRVRTTRVRTYDGSACSAGYSGSRFFFFFFTYACRHHVRRAGDAAWSHSVDRRPLSLGASALGGCAAPGVWQGA
jgi:hypothetical protein